MWEDQTLARRDWSFFFFLRSAWTFVIIKVSMLNFVYILSFIGGSLPQPSFFFFIFFSKNSLKILFLKIKSIDFVLLFFDCRIVDLQSCVSGIHQSDSDSISDSFARCIYNRILSIVPCAIKEDIVVCLFYV